MMRIGNIDKQKSERQINNNKKHSIMKKILFLLLCILAGAQTVNAQEAYAVYTDNNTTLTFYYDTQRSSRTGTTYSLNWGANDPKWVQDGTNAKVTRVVFDSSFKNARPETTYMWFYSMGNLTSIIGMKEYLNTSEVSIISYMFDNCSALTSIDVSGFNTAKVTRMDGMFGGCSALSSLDISNFNTANVVNMYSMFSSCSALTKLELGNLNTTKVTDMGNMFGSCFNLKTLNLTSFNTYNVSKMSYMFGNCQALTTIYVSDSWSTRLVEPATEMFYLCKKLVSLSPMQTTIAAR